MSKQFDQTWAVFDGKGRVRVREEGQIVYDGPVADMPERIKALVDSMHFLNDAVAEEEES